MDYIIDFQGFITSKNKFIFKEVVIIGIEEDAIPEVSHFLPPCEWKNLSSKEKSTGRWLEWNFHGLPWQSGDIPYYQLEESIQDSLIYANRIYVKGEEKLRWLKPILRNK